MTEHGVLTSLVCIFLMNGRFYVDCAVNNTCQGNTFCLHGLRQQALRKKTLSRIVAFLALHGLCQQALLQKILCVNWFQIRELSK